MDQENDDMMDNSDEFSEGSNLCSDESDLKNESSGNAAWADAMSKVLNTKISKEKFILSKARKDSEIVKQAKRKHEIELVDDSGNVKKTEEIRSKEVKNYKALRREMLEKQKQVIFYCIIMQGSVQVFTQGPIFVNYFYFCKKRKEKKENFTQQILITGFKSNLISIKKKK